MPITTTYRFFQGCLPSHLRGWIGDDPERIVRDILADQLLAVRKITLCDCDVAGEVWANRLACQSIVFRDESDRARRLVLTSQLPDRLLRGMPPHAVGFGVCMSRINSGRPFRIEWIVPFGLDGPIGFRFGDVELYPGQAAVIFCRKVLIGDE